MNYSFDTQVAQEYGVEEAIIYQNIQFWCEKNWANKEHIYDGKAWTYNTLEAWMELFPFWKRTKIFRILQRMEEKGMIAKGHFNQNPFKRETYYSDLLKYGNSVFGISEIPNTENVEIPDSEYDYKGTDINTDINPDVNNTDLEFDRFWKSYPRKENKKGARGKYRLYKKKGLLPDIDDHIQIIESWKQTDKWKSGFIPHATTWLNGSRWEDELPETEIKPGTTSVNIWEEAAAERGEVYIPPEKREAVV